MRFFIFILFLVACGKSPEQVPTTSASNSSSSLFSVTCQTSVPLSNVNAIEFRIEEKSNGTREAFCAVIDNGKVVMDKAVHSGISDIASTCKVVYGNDTYVFKATDSFQHGSFLKPGNWEMRVGSDAFEFTKVTCRENAFSDVEEGF